MSVRFPYSPARTPPIPALVVTLRAPDGSRQLPNISAHLATAADRTLVPLSLIQQLGLSPVRRVQVHGLGTTALISDVYAVDIEIPGVAVVVTEAITHAREPFVLLGRELLNLFHRSFDGPNQVVEFR